jgi:tetratricopeptide (TPR) repeat protein
MRNSIKKHIISLLDEAEFSGLRENYQGLFSYLTSIESDHLEDSNYHYYKGYVALTFPDSEDFYRKIALKELKLSLEIDPNNKNAFYHLANCYYELGNYQNALDGYSDILKLLSHENKALVGISVLERILVCYLKLNRRGKFLTNYNLWIRAYRTLQDIDMMTIPRDLVIEVSSYLKAKGEGMELEQQKQFKNICTDLLSIINLFPKAKKNYKNEIESLKNWDGQYSGPYILELV